MKTPAQVALFALLILLAGCSLMEPDGADGTLTIRTDQEMYSYDYSEYSISIRAIVQNNYGKPVYIPEPFGTPALPLARPAFFLEKLVDGEWTKAYWPSVIPAVLQPPTKFNDGEGFSSTFSIQILDGRGKTRSENWHIEGPLTGTYRLVIAAQTSRGNAENLYTGDSLPLAKRTSDVFEIREVGYRK